MKPPKHIDTGLADPEKIARKLAWHSLTMVQLMRYEGPGYEIQRMACDAVNTYKQLFHAISRDDFARCDHNDPVNRLMQDASFVWAIADAPDISPKVKKLAVYLARQYERIAEAYNKGWCEQMFPMLVEQASSKDNRLRVSRMQDYRLSAYCKDCDEMIFERLQVSLIKEMTGQDYVWGRFDIVCAKDRSHTVEVSSTYCDNTTRDGPSYYRGRKLEIGSDGLVCKPEGEFKQSDP